MLKKSLLMMLLMALFAPLAMQAQNTVTVCDGDTTSQYVPVYGYWADVENYSEFIFPSTTTGLSNLVGKEITGMTFYLQTPAQQAWGTYEVYMREVDFTTQTNTWTRSGTTVYTGEFDGTGSTMEITFDAGYTYQGGNLLVGTHSEGGNYSSAYFYGAEAEEGASIYVIDYYGQWSGGPVAFLPKTTFTYSEFNMPADLTVTSVAQTTATIGWTAPNANVTGYQYQYQVDGGDWSTLQSTTSTSAPLSSLREATTYNFRVKAIYSGGESNFASLTFRTKCNAFAIPYDYGFEDETDLDCWTMVDCEYDNSNYLSGIVNDASYANNGDQFYGFSSYNGAVGPPQYLISPELSGITNALHVEFWYRSIDDGYNETFHVGYSTTTEDVNAFTWGDEITSSSATYTLFKSNYPAGTKYIAVQYTSDYMYYLLLDDFSFTEAPSCLEPTDVVASSITTTGASIGWTAGTDETAWDVYVTNDANDVPDETTTPTIANTANNPESLTGLTSGTIYYVYVRAICSENESSGWSNPGVFNTACETIDLPFTYGFEVDALPVCWTVINTNVNYNNVLVKTNYPNTGTHNLDLRRGSPDGTEIVVLPEVNSTYALNAYQVSFYAKVSTDFGATLTVGIMEDPNDETTFEALGDAIEPTTTYAQYTVMLNSYTGRGQYIAIKHESTSYGNTYLDDLEVKPLPTCLMPTGLTATVTGTSAELSWTANSNETAWTLYWKSTSDANYNEVPVADRPSTTLNGLTPGTNYVYYVVANCSASDTSDPSEVFNFVTECGTITIDASNVYSQGFEGYTGTTYSANGVVPACWDSYSTGTVAPHIIVSGGSYAYIHEGTNALTFYGSGDCYAALPEFANALSELRISFWMRTESASYGTLSLGYITAQDENYNTFTEIASYDKSTTYVQRTTDLNNVPATATRLVFKWTYTSQWSCCIDDVVVKLIPTCMEPTALVVNNVTTTTANVGWTENGNATAWEIMLNGDDTNPIPAPTNPFTIENLTPATDYTFQVRAVCSETDQSEWSSAGSFTTACDVITVDADHPYTQGFEGTSFPPTCWENIASGSYAWKSSAEAYTSYVHGGSKSAYSGYYGDIYLVMPDIELASSASTAQLTFWSYNSYASDYDKNSVVLMDNNGTETELWTTASVSSEWVETTVDLSAYIGQTISLAFKYEGDNAHGWYLDDVEVSVTAASNTVTQTIELVSGWNWFSTYIEMDPVALLEAIETQLGENGLQIVSKGKVTSYDPDEEEWGGGLQSIGITNGNTYMIEMDANITSVTVTLEGPASTPDSYSVTINEGWTWIGFPCAEQVAINVALADFEAAPDDEIVSKNKASSYDADEEEWSGSLVILKPGEGYMYHSNSTTPKTLTFRTGTTKK